VCVRVCRVLRSFHVPGCAPPRPEVLLYLFQLCRKQGSGEVVGTEGETGEAALADPNCLFELMFGSPVQVRRQQQLPREQRYLETQMQTGE
jgi:hypothetical protein